MAIVTQFEVKRISSKRLIILANVAFASTARQRQRDRAGDQRGGRLLTRLGGAGGQTGKSRDPRRVTTIRYWRGGVG